MKGYQQIEKDGLTALIDETRIDVLQLKNLNIDPDYYLSQMPYSDDPGVGLLKMMIDLPKEFAHLRLGYFNKPKEEFLSSSAQSDPPDDAPHDK